jgi:hypothetical protein
VGLRDHVAGKIEAVVVQRMRADLEAGGSHQRDGLGFAHADDVGDL